jgi:hypothetical protein
VERHPNAMLRSPLEHRQLAPRPLDESAMHRPNTPSRPHCRTGPVGRAATVASVELLAAALAMLA